MKSSNLTFPKTKNLNWDSPLNSLFGKKESKNLISLENVGFRLLRDLLWIFPLRIEKIPPVRDFSHLQEGEMFRGIGSKLAVQARSNFRVRGKRGIPLNNIVLTVRDSYSSKTISLKWFNAYPSVVKKLKSLESFHFSGIVQVYQGNYQIINPDIETDIEKIAPNEEGILITYPTVNSVPSSYILKLMNKIPSEFWDELPETLPLEIIDLHKLMPRSLAFKIIHGRHFSSRSDEIEQAKQRLIYEEFFEEQLKIMARRNSKKTISAPRFAIDRMNKDLILSAFPYALTTDQEIAVSDIEKDFSKGAPMMRLLQGDVGSGKTSVALIAAYIAVKQGYQVAFMCPTENLAQQHFETAKNIFSKLLIQIGLVIGGQKPKEKKEKLFQLEMGETHIVFGTHALFQESVKFKKLGLAIIDEQHKFGVKQRLKLINKGEGVHCLIMTATPIPRSLCLTQYGDLDISSIQTMPRGRKEIQTRIVFPENFKKFLSFVANRIQRGEQSYLVVPAITENEKLDILNLEETLETYEKYFPMLSIRGLHGKMSSEEKIQTLTDFKNKKFQILVSTSVIEVGINIVNASIMAILSPERFGLSSLHQLRGRVGRGDLPGFCFLVVDKKLAPESLSRLQVIEKTLNGFIIAEEDLKMRGQGNLFGNEQSGHNGQRKISDIVRDQKSLMTVKDDLEAFKNHPSIIKSVKDYSFDQNILSTI